MTLGVVVGKFLPPHRGHSYLIESAQQGCDEVLVIVCARSDDLIPAPLRAGMLRELHPGATVVVSPDDIPDDRGDDTSRAWAQRTRELSSACFGRSADLVYSSEAYGPRYAHFLGARHVSVDPDRVRFPVSGTAVRRDPWGQAEFLAPCVRAWFVSRIVVLGAESTGTTTLCQDLSVHYGCPWVPEYGRTYCERRPGPIRWRTADFIHIASGQLTDEDTAARACGPLLICDTDALATSVWHERYLGHRSAAVERLAADRRYALHILTADDIPFVQDGTRDGEHIRGWMTQRLREVLAASGRGWLEVRGSRAERLDAAVRAIDALGPPQYARIQYARRRRPPRGTPPPCDE
jgi:HTH-type transcriptional regulator, transcriptional repressor of NAD biosynthesis genes